MEKFLLGRPASTLRYAVFAERNCADPNEGIDSLWAAWTRLRRSVQWKRKVRGCIAALEVTYNAKTKTYHPHLNVLMEGEYIAFEELKLMWMSVSSGQTAFIRAADAGTVRELIKYVTKISDLIDNPEALDAFLGAIEKRRLVRTYGSFYGLSVDDEESPKKECPSCESTCMVKLECVHPSQVSFDFETQSFRIIRLDRARLQQALEDASSFDPARIAYEYRRSCERLALAREAKSFKKFRHWMGGLNTGPERGIPHVES